MRTGSSRTIEPQVRWSEGTYCFTELDPSERKNFTFESAETYLRVDDFLYLRREQDENLRFVTANKVSEEAKFTLPLPNARSRCRYR